MAKARLRSVNTHFWTDSYIIELDPTEKLLFLYLLTNPLSNIAGCYEISLRQIAFDTGIDRDMVTKILQRFEDKRKIVYREGWILLVNFQKNQNLNENMRKGAEALLSVAPEWVKKPFERLSKDSKGFERLSNGSVNTYREIEREVEVEDEREDEGEPASPPPPENPLASVADELAIQTVETAFDIRLDLATRSRVKQAVPPDLIDRFPAFINGRAVGYSNKSPTEKLTRIGYALTDFQKDNKQNGSTITTTYRDAREQQAIAERNFYDDIRAELDGNGHVPQTDAFDSGRQLRMLGAKPDEG